MPPRDPSPPSRRPVRPPARVKRDVRAKEDASPTSRLRAARQRQLSDDGSSNLRDDKALRAQRLAARFEEPEWVDENEAAATDSRRARFGEGANFLLRALNDRPIARRMMSGLALLLAVAGVGMLAYPFATNVYSNRLQQQLERELFTPALANKYREGKLEVGDSLTRIAIPSINIDVVVVEGTSATALRAGAGHYTNTPLPGEEGNVAIAGHRTTYGKPFANLDKLVTGAEIILDTPIGTNYYKVSRDYEIVAANDWRPIEQSPGKTLTLTTCHPKGSARQRLIIKAEFVRSEEKQVTAEG